MSLILDALRKMEEDRKSRRNSALDIRPEVLRYRAAVKPQQEKPYLPMAIGLVLLAAGIGAGIFLKGSGGKTATQTAAANLPAMQAETTPMAPIAPVPAGIPAAALQPSVAPAAAPAAPPATTVVPPAAVVTEKASQPLYNSAPASDSKKARKRAAARSVANDAGLPQSTSQRRDASEVLQTLPEISITGIAWQDERSLRRAVLNGVLVGEGAEVAGARVVEIRESKVRLSRGGQLFEVVMSSGQSR